MTTFDTDVEGEEVEERIDFSSIWGHLNKKKLATSAVEQAGRFMLRSAIGPRRSRGKPLEDLLGLGMGMVKSGLGVSDKWSVGKDGQEQIDYDPVDAQTAAEYWVSTSEKKWCVALVIGRQGSGKTALCAFLAQLWEDAQMKPSIWVGADQDALNTLQLSARAITVGEFVVLMESGTLSNATVIVEDATRMFDQFSASTRATQALQNFQAVHCRKNQICLCLNSQSSAILGKHQLPNMVLSKASHLSAADEERGGQAARSRRADRAFALLGSANEARKYAWIEDGDLTFRGLVRVPLPRHWSERFSQSTG